ncbi:hypothetical protein MED01_002349 [Micromonospora sp. MED01]|uniref:hypothetical protein n=1 Tax=Micromonospora alfalfae TaxID=2911212 RepID=UPI001EE7F732|nr:hypothetical protein [Micromonospora alfalfae]MCG5464184.1 hypothetical protein [Micromonospora alfalfae]
MTVTDIHLRDLFELIRKGRVEINPDWLYADRLTGTVIDDAVYEAAERGLVELHADGSVKTTKPGRRWLSDLILAENPALRPVVFQPPAGH